MAFNSRAGVSTVEHGAGRRRPGRLKGLRRRYG